MMASADHSRSFLVAAGHGGRDPGNVSNGHHEAVLMLELRHLVALKLTERGHTVRQDGRRLENLPLARAMEMITSGVVAIELHTNTGPTPTASGVEVVAAPGNVVLAQRIAAAIAAVMGTPVRRERGLYPVAQFKRDRGFTPGFVRRGGLIVEVFFQSNVRELAVYLDRKWLVASAIAEALSGDSSPA